MRILRGRRVERQIIVARAWWLQNRHETSEAFDEELEKADKLLHSACTVT